VKYNFLIKIDSKIFAINIINSIYNKTLINNYIKNITDKYKIYDIIIKKLL
jgi:uncharacterized membrane protein